MSTFIVFQTQAFRDKLHRRDNQYRYDTIDEQWEFNDGVGPWTPSSKLEGMDLDDGEKYLRRDGYTRNT